MAAPLIRAMELSFGAHSRIGLPLNRSRYAGRYPSTLFSVKRIALIWINEPGCRSPISIG